MKQQTITLYPLVENSSLRRWRLYYLAVPYIILTCALYPFLPLFYTAQALAIPMIIYFFYLQKEYKKNLKLWKRKPGDATEITIDMANSKIAIGGYELNSDDIDYVKVDYSEAPAMSGITKYIFYTFCMNCLLEIHTKGNRVITMPLHMRSNIRKIVKSLARGKYQVSFDQKIYKFCGLQD